jgi:beta-exotoxin I transport system permease protein
VSPLLKVSLATQRRAVLGWGIGLAAVATMYAAFYPSITQSAGEMETFLKNMPDAFKELVGGDYTSPAGYLRAELFSLLGPILFLVYAVGAGGKALAGEEEARSLDLLLSTPLSRARVVRDKALAMLISMFGLSAFLFVMVVGVGRPFDLIVPVQDAAAACVMLLLVGLAFGSIALAVGCATGRKSTAFAVTGVVAVATYVLNVLAPSVSSLEWSRPLSPFRWYLAPDPLTTGLHAANVTVLIAITTVSTAFAFWSFRRRDLAA